MEADAPIWVASFNVLTPPFCDTVDGEIRYKRVLEKLEEQVARGAIICMQEVCVTWTQRFLVYFAERGYTYVYRHYHWRKSDYMGIAIAFPTRLYTLRAAELRCIVIAAALGEPSPTLADEEAPDAPACEAMIAAAQFWAEDVCRRENSLVALQLETRSGRRFWTCTTHLPCTHECPSVSVVFATLATRFMQTLAERDGVPLVMTGDYNILPGSSTYQLISTGSLPADHPDRPPRHPVLEFECALPSPMRSAYVQATGAEPELTNYNGMPGSNLFTGTLDYVWLSGAVQAVEALRLPSKAALGETGLPTAEEPSDHLLIAARVELREA